MYSYEDCLESILSFQDLSIGLLILAIFMLFGIGYARKYTGIFQKYFIYALVIRLLTSLVIAFLVKFYYAGDSVMYYAGAMQIIHSDNAAFIDFMTTLKSENWTDATWGFLYSDPKIFFGDLGNNLAGRIAVFPAIVFFNSYIAISLFYGVLGFIGCWKLFKVFSDQYHHLTHHFAYGILFFPSLFYWGNSIMKDPITLCGLGLMVESVYLIFFKKKHIYISLIKGAFALILTFLIKSYIVLAFLPAAFLWILYTYRSNIKNLMVKTLLTPLTFLFILIVGYVSVNQLSQSTLTPKAGKFSTDNLLTSITVSQNVAFGGSYYTLGDFDGSFVGLLKMFPLAVNAALFRPYLWEVSNVFMLLFSLENLFLFVFTFSTIYRVGIWRVFSIISKNPFILFCLVFSIFFAGMVGISTYNFGTLARYRIPLLPFYFAAIVVINDSFQKSKLLNHFSKKL